MPFTHFTKETCANGKASCYSVEKYFIVPNLGGISHSSHRIVSLTPCNETVSVHHR